MQDVVVVLTMVFPMLLFALYPGFKLGDYLEKKYLITEKTKIVVTVLTALIVAILLSLFVHLAW